MITLNAPQRAHFIAHGYLHVPGVVPKLMVDRALQAINHSLGDGIDPARIQTFRSQSYAPELQREPVITDLFNKTLAIELASGLIGALEPIRGGQIALRFPTLSDAPRVHGPHLDGMYSPHNGVPVGTIQSFSLLLGVMLSDVPQPFMGNLSVWPGTHRLYETYFREHGPEKLLDGMPPIPLPEPVQMLGRAGDVVLCHYQLAHSIAENASAHVRYAIYFRVHAVGHAARWKEALTDIWLEYPGLQAAQPV